MTDISLDGKGRRSFALPANTVIGHSVQIKLETKTCCSTWFHFRKAVYDKADSNG
jgi:hypothetical protein